LVPKSEVLHLKGDARFERGDHGECAECQTEDLTEDVQTPCSHSERMSIGRCRPSGHPRDICASILLRVVRPRRVGVGRVPEAVPDPGLGHNVLGVGRIIFDLFSQ